MQNIGLSGPVGLENHGLQNLRSVYWNLVPAELVEQATIRREGQLAATGPLLVNTGKHTGRSPEDKFVAHTSSLDDEAIWWGKVNQPLAPEKFHQIYQKMKAYLQGRDVFVQDMQVGAHPSYRTSVRIVSEQAWASLFAHNLFRRLSPREIAHFRPD